MKPSKGKLLIAEPSILNDSSFNRSIIYITEHTEKNTVGFILNRPLEYSINDLIPEIDSSFMVYQGGPVEQDNLYFVHKVPKLITDSIEIGDGMYWGGNFEVLKKLLNTHQLDTSDIRFFLGYSGWSKHQLNDELHNKSWFVANNDFQNILSIEEENFWKNQLLQKGGDYKLWANAPSDVNLN